MTTPAAPAVSVILTTYNRATLLPQAFAAIRAQQFQDWELIVVDDGSTDDTAAVVAALAADQPQPLRYVSQENQGCAGARNTGLEHARGEFIAFFDDDDVALPHHLETCVAALRAHPEVSWVYGASRVVDKVSGQIRAESSFYDQGRPRPFLRLHVRRDGPLHIIEDPRTLEYQLLYGLFSGMQNSVVRRSVFAGLRFDTRHRNPIDDQIILLHALAAGHCLAYFNRVHLIYYVHAGNASAANPISSVETRLHVYQTGIACLETLARELPLRGAQQRALRRRLCREYFWHVGYSLLWQHGRRAEALVMYRRGLAYWPWDWRCWKTFLLARLRGR